MGNPSLSVVIVTRNRLDKLKRCLDSVRQKMPFAQVIVVDNGSNDGTVEYLKKRSDITSLFLPKNIGVAAGRNAGIERTTGDFVMFLDDDAWIGELNMTHIVDYFSLKPKVALVAPRILYPDGRLQESIRRFPTLSFILRRGLVSFHLLRSTKGYEKHLEHDTTRMHLIDWAIGACLIIRRDVFQRIGLFDGKFFSVYDDVDFCLRLRKKDLTAIYWPDATVYHEYSRTSTKGFNISLLRHIRSVFRYFIKSALNY